MRQSRVPYLHIVINTSQKVVPFSHGMNMDIVPAMVLVLMIALTIFTLLTNSTLLYILISRSRLRNDPPNLFLMNLCAIGVTASVTVFPITVTNFVVGKYFLPQSFCHFTGFLNTLLTLADIFTVCVVSIDHYIFLAHPMLHTTTVTGFRTVIVVIITWIIAVIIAVLPLVGWSRYSFQPNRTRCSYSLSREPYARSYVITIAVVGFLLPLCLFLCMYIAIFHVAKSSQRQVRPVPSSITTICQLTVATNSSRDSDSSVLSTSLTTLGFKKISKAAKTLLLITGTFVFFFSPQFLVELFTYEDNLPYEAGLFLSWLNYTSLALHPILYSCLNCVIREQVVIFLRNFKTYCRYNNNERTNRSGEVESFYQFLERTSVVNEVDVERTNL